MKESPATSPPWPQSPKEEAEAKIAALKKKIETLDKSLTWMVELFETQEKLQKNRQEPTKEKLSLDESHGKSKNPKQKDLNLGYSKSKSRRDRRRNANEKSRHASSSHSNRGQSWVEVSNTKTLTKGTLETNLWKLLKEK